MNFIIELLLSFINDNGLYVLIICLYEYMFIYLYVYIKKGLYI
jgi:hypothetical protein